MRSQPPALQPLPQGGPGGVVGRVVVRGLLWGRENELWRATDPKGVGCGLWFFKPYTWDLNQLINEYKRVCTEGKIGKYQQGIVLVNRDTWFCVGADSGVAVGIL